MGDRVTLFPQHTLTTTMVPRMGLTEIVRDYRWVQALSMAIDREEINQTLFYGTAKMGAMSPDADFQVLQTGVRHRPWRSTTTTPPTSCWMTWA